MSNVPNLRRHIAVGEVLLRPEQQGVKGHTKFHGLRGCLCCTHLCDAPNLLVELLGSQLSLQLLLSVDDALLLGNGGGAGILKLCASDGLHGNGKEGSKWAGIRFYRIHQPSVCLTS